MPRVAIPIQTTPPYPAEIDSITMTAADAVNNHEFTNDGRTILIARNTDASAKTITIVSVADRMGRTGDLSVVVPGGSNAIGFVPPLPPEGFNQPGGLVHVNVSEATGLSLAAIRISPAI